MQYDDDSVFPEDTYTFSVLTAGGYAEIRIARTQWDIPAAVTVDPLGSPPAESYLRLFFGRHGVDMQGKLVSLDLAAPADIYNSLLAYQADNPVLVENFEVLRGYVPAGEIDLGGDTGDDDDKPVLESAGGWAPWIGFDLDGTLAKKVPGDQTAAGAIGEPVWPMIETLKNHLQRGETVKIFTARAADPDQVPKVRAWLKELGLDLEITNEKDPGMTKLYDDRATPVVEDLGAVLESAVSFKKKRFTLQDRYQFQGMPISIENSAGTVRKGIDPDGHEWRTKMHFDYGYIRRTKGADGEGVDVYVGPDRDAQHVYIVKQHKIAAVKKWGTEFCPECHEHAYDCACKKFYDEDKVFIGFPSKKAAIEAYKKQYDSPLFLGPVSTMKVEDFRDLVTGKAEKVTIPLQFVTESTLAVPLRIEKRSNTYDVWICPHCNNEIREKELFMDNIGHGRAFWRHRPCGGRIELPESDDEIDSLLSPHFVAESAEGSWDLQPGIVGRISESAAVKIQALGLPFNPGPVVVTATNARHINTSHGKQLEKADEQVLKQAIENPSEILPNKALPGKGYRAKSVLMVRRNGGDYVAIVEIAQDGNRNVLWNFWKFKNRKKADNYLAKFGNKKTLIAESGGRQSSYSSQHGPGAKVGKPESLSGSRTQQLGLFKNITLLFEVKGIFESSPFADWQDSIYAARSFIEIESVFDQMGLADRTIDLPPPGEPTDEQIESGKQAFLAQLKAEIESLKSSRKRYDRERRRSLEEDFEWYTDSDDAAQADLREKALSLIKERTERENMTEIGRVESPTSGMIRVYSLGRNSEGYSVLTADVYSMADDPAPGNHFSGPTASTAEGAMVVALLHGGDRVWSMLGAVVPVRVRDAALRLKAVQDELDEIDYRDPDKDSAGYKIYKAAQNMLVALTDAVRFEGVAAAEKNLVPEIRKQVIYPERAYQKKVAEKQAKQRAEEAEEAEETERRHRQIDKNRPLLDKFFSKVKAKKRQFEVMMSDGKGGSYTKSVDGWGYGDHLATHKEEKGWVVTHVKTGLAIGKHFRKKAAAVEWMWRLSHLGGDDMWDFESSDEIPDGLRDLVGQAFQEMNDAVIPEGTGIQAP